MNDKIKGDPPVGPSVPSGFPDYQFKMMSGFLFLWVVYFGTIGAFKKIQAILDLPPTIPKYCKDPGHGNSGEQVCWRADLFACEVTCGIALLCSSMVGFWAWHIQRVHLVPATAEGRLFGYHPAAHQLTALQTTYYLFDFFLCLLIPEHRDPLFLCHHLMATIVSWYGLNNQYFHYYGLYYLGCNEIPRILLIFIEVAYYHPPRRGTAWEQFVNGLCWPIFVATFTIYSVVLWWVVGYQMFHDCFAVLRNGMANKLRPGRNHVVYTMMIFGFLLGLLQLYWYRLILKEAAQVLGLNGLFPTSSTSRNPMEE